MKTSKTDNVPHKSPRSTKSKIIIATRELFYELGFDGYTVEDILERAGVSRGTFYHYFNSKDDILANWVLLYDEKYAAWYENMDRSADPLNRVKEFNRFILEQQGKMDISIKRKQFSAQAISKGNSYFFDKKRALYTIPQELFAEGQEKGVVKRAFSCYELSSMFLTIQRGVIYDWCVANGAYSLVDYGDRTMGIFLEGMRVVS